MRTLRPSLGPALLVFSLAACAADPGPAAVSAPPPPPPPVVAVAPAVPPPPAAPAAPPPPPVDDKFAGVTVKVQKVAGSVYMLQGAGGNIGVSVGDDGIVLVDDEFAPLAPKVKDALRTISDKPIKVVLNTHWHGDHTGANAVFGESAPIVAQENVRKRLVSGGPALRIGEQAIPPTPPAAHGALPVLTFDDRVFVHLNGEDIRAIHFPAGHTDGDSVIVFTQSNVVHMGDDFVTYGFPFVDLTSGGSVRGMIAALDKVVAQVPSDAKVIPGHGDLATIDDVKKLSVALKDCVRLIDAEVKKKRTLAQIQAAKVLANYDDLAKGPIKADLFAETLFKELTGQPGVYVPH
jgi:glyoxylase-like metal-dependent hydrolase (beta-lactamase superfamily II)